MPYFVNDEPAPKQERLQSIEDRERFVYSSSVAECWVHSAEFDVRVFSPYYHESFVYALRRLLERHGASVEYNMIPDGAALLG